MSKFIIRVQLHGAGPEEYTTLHEEMSSSGILRRIHSDNDLWFDLPDGEYFADGLAMSSESVRFLVQGIIWRTSPHGGDVMVTEIASASWSLHLWNPIQTYGRGYHKLSSVA